MNFPFLKLYLANSAWVLFDVEACKNLQANKQEWCTVAKNVCNSVTGVSARGIVVINKKTEPVQIVCIDSIGNRIIPLPSAVMCAARWVFDTGLHSVENLTFTCDEDIFEPIVIDSANIGLSVGNAYSAEGTNLEASFQKGSIGLSANGSRIVFPIKLGSESINVALLDAPPTKKNSHLHTKHDPNSPIEVFPVSRFDLRVKAGYFDPVYASGAALAAAVVADFADREARISIGGTKCVAQWPEGAAVFIASAPEYSISGDFWMEL